MFIALITDCRDDNAVGRISARISSLMNTCPSLIRVSDDLSLKGEIEASGNLVDVLDASEGRKGVVLVNTAPRNGLAREKWDNGTPFCFFYYGDTLIIATVDGYTLSLVKKLEITDFISIISLDKTVPEIFKEKDNFNPERILRSQFRSFDFLPDLANNLINGGNVEAEERSVEDITGVDDLVWWIDNFGNLKTTLLEEDISRRSDQTVETIFGLLRYYPSLKDVPEGEMAIVSGSSGLKDRRFLEIVMQGGSASEKLNVSVGNHIFS